MRYLIAILLLPAFCFAGYGDGTDKECDRQASEVFDKCNAECGKDCEINCFDQAYDAHDDCTGEDTSNKAMLANNKNDHYEMSEEAKNEIGKIISRDYQLLLLRRLGQGPPKHFELTEGAKEKTLDVFAKDYCQYMGTDPDCALDAYQDYLKRDQDCIDSYDNHDDRDQYKACVKQNIDQYNRDHDHCPHPELDEVQKSIDDDPELSKHDVPDEVIGWCCAETGADRPVYGRDFGPCLEDIPSADGCRDYDMGCGELRKMTRKEMFDLIFWGTGERTPNCDVDINPASKHKRRIGNRDIRDMFRQKLRCDVGNNFSGFSDGRGFSGPNLF